jgi:hypothetical protein
VTTIHDFQQVQSSEGPDLTGTETPFNHGYAALIVLGSQRVSYGPPGSREWDKLLHWLLRHGLPADVPDIMGYTALHHATMNPARNLSLARILLEAPTPANVNFQNRRGMVPLFGPMMNGVLDAVDLLFEFGADLDVAEADGYTPAKTYITYGPEITATIHKWLRKRKGEAALMQEKACGYPQCLNVFTDGTKPKLMVCSRCKTTRYCSVKCQRADWQSHKPNCAKFSGSATVTLKPFYQPNNTTTMQTASVVRRMQSMRTELPATETHGSHVPKSLGKAIVIKVQVPPESNDGPLLVYTKKRDFFCMVLKADNGTEYDKIVSVIREKGPMGLKAYFSAELRSTDELVVKVSEVLAEQPF